jgi:hypothetical protein
MDALSGSGSRRAGPCGLASWCTRYSVIVAPDLALPGSMVLHPVVPGLVLADSVHLEPAIPWLDMAGFETLRTVALCFDLHLHLHLHLWNRVLQEKQRRRVGPARCLVQPRFPFSSDFWSSELAPGGLRICPRSTILQTQVRE